MWTDFAACLAVMLRLPTTSVLPFMQLCPWHTCALAAPLHQVQLMLLLAVCCFTSYRLANTLPLPKRHPSASLQTCLNLVNFSLSLEIWLRHQWQDSSIFAPFIPFWDVTSLHLYLHHQKRNCQNRSQVAVNTDHCVLGTSLVYEKLDLN